MATWEDGPEYAPIERPDAFSEPPVAPLSAAQPYVQPAAGAPVERPRFGQPQVPVIPLADLVPLPEEPRDPTIPYEVVTSAVTSGDSAWGAVHWQPPTSPTPATGSPWGDGFTTGAPNSWPSGPLTPSHPPSQGPTGLPQPGTAQWFAPAPYQPGPPPPPASGKDIVTAVTPALLIMLALGGLIHPVAPITLVVAWALASRVGVAKREIQAAFVIAIATLAVVGLFIGFAGTLDFADWWNGLSWLALVLSWAMVPTVILLVRRAFRLGQRPPTRPTTWA